MWCNEIGKNIIKEVKVEIVNETVSYVDSKGKPIIKHINITGKNCLICKSNKNLQYGMIHKYDHKNKKYFYCLGNNYYPFTQKNLQDKNSEVKEKDIKLVLDQTNLSRADAIHQLQKNNIVTVLMEYSI
jgi:NACalpha-BTF3-like transcription factor